MGKIVLFSFAVNKKNYLKIKFIFELNNVTPNKLEFYILSEEEGYEEGVHEQSSVAGWGCQKDARSPEKREP